MREHLVGSLIIQSEGVAINLARGFAYTKQLEAERDRERDAHAAEVKSLRDDVAFWRGRAIELEEHLEEAYQDTVFRLSHPGHGTPRELDKLNEARAKLAPAGESGPRVGDIHAVRKQREAELKEQAKREGKIIRTSFDIHREAKMREEAERVAAIQEKVSGNGAAHAEHSG